VIGTTAGSYRITDVLSVGGMGTVYRAEHTLIGRPAAVKVLHPEMSANKDIVHRFFNEAKATTSIKHPGIVEIYDYGNLDSGHAYLVMEFLEGRTLATRNKQRGAIHEAEAAAVLRGVCAALAAAHAKGIVHRDLKPDNIFLVPDADSQLGERVKILDFGIAKLTDIGLAGNATKTGSVMGTPTYMSPEQCKGTGDVDHRADLYSIGCMFYEMVAARPPFDMRGAGELIGAHLFMEPAPPSKHGAQLSSEAEALIMALLAKDPARRPQTAAELSQLLANIAARGGYGSSTNWERPSMPAMASPAAHAPNPAHYTPSHSAAPNPAHYTPSHSEAPTRFTPNPAPAHYTPNHAATPAHYTPRHTPPPDARASSEHLPYTPAHYTPPPDGRASSEHLPYTPAHYTPPPDARASSQHLPYPPGYGPNTIPGHGPSSPAMLTPTTSEKPTTLSGAASQATTPARSSKKWLALGALAVAAGAAVAIVVATRNPRSDASTVQPTTAPAETVEQPATPSVPASAPTTATTPANAQAVEQVDAGTAPTPTTAAEKTSGTRTPDPTPPATTPKSSGTTSNTKSTNTSTTRNPSNQTKTKTKTKTKTSDPLLETDL
jgi:serine/threonine protein kinase